MKIRSTRRYLPQLSVSLKTNHAAIWRPVREAGIVSNEGDLASSRSIALHQPEFAFRIRVNNRVSVGGVRRTFAISEAASGPPPSVRTLKRELSEPDSSSVETSRLDPSGETSIRRKMPGSATGTCAISPPATATWARDFGCIYVK